MEFLYIDQFLQDKGLNNPTLEVLIPNAKLYSTLLFQPYGKIVAGDYFVKNKDLDLAKSKFESFFNIAFEKKIDLCITPEYSCPWSVIVHLLENNIFPYEKGLWIIGTESILQEEFEKVVADNTDICWIYDKELFQCTKSDKFLNPVCYFFLTKNANNNVMQKVIVVQFKTNPMGGEHFERDKLLTGNTVYILRNDEDSIFLATIICSDALDFNMNLLKGKQQAYLIIHIQLNSKPLNLRFSDYRRAYYTAIDDTIKREILTLNWAHKTCLCDKELIYGGSAYYTKSKKTNIDDININSNHYKGLYYSYCDTMHANIFFLNYDEFIYEYENTKVLQMDSAVQQQNHTGPIMKDLYFWQNSMWNSDNLANDHLKDICTEIDCDFSALLDNKLTPINKERLIGLSIGNITEEKHLKPNNLASFKVTGYADCCDINKRLTFFQDPNTDAKDEKTECLMKFSELVNSIINNDINIPENIKDLAGNYKIKYIPNNSNYSGYYNIYSKDEETPATIVFLGQTIKPKAQDTFDKMCNLFNDSLSDKRLIVWYKDGMGEIKTIYKQSTPKITSTANIKNNSLRKGE